VSPRRAHPQGPGPLPSLLMMWAGVGESRGWRWARKLRKQQQRRMQQAKTCNTREVGLLKEVPCMFVCRAANRSCGGFCVPATCSRWLDRPKPRCSPAVLLLAGRRRPSCCHAVTHTEQVRPSLPAGLFNVGSLGLTRAPPARSESAATASAGSAQTSGHAFAPRRPLW